MCKFRTLTADEIDCRVSQINQKGLSLLLYKDARCDMNILDETVGEMNWRREHTRDNANCIVSIWCEEKHEWIPKEDTGTESNTEAEKGLASDSFKRACVNWGIGRELYTAPFIYISADKCSIEKNDKGRFLTYDKFAVSRIDYDEKRNIKALEIINSKTKAVVFSMGYTKHEPKPEPKSEPKPEPKPLATIEHIDPGKVYKCECCGAEIVPFKGKTPMELILNSKMMFGRMMCGRCCVKAGKNADQ